MAPQDVLTTIAEISIALAGFTGLVAAFRQFGGYRWSFEERLRITMLIVLSFTVIICALSPFALGGMTVTSSLILFLFAKDQSRITKRTV